jgi:uncharacterized membrane protein YeaQ/YmgE (transglycosylase-associated protein family)
MNNSSSTKISSGTIALVVLAVIGALVVFSFARPFLELAVALISWMLAGVIAGRLIRGEGYSLLGNLALGLIGGVMGSLVLRVIGLGWLGNIWLVGNIIVGVIGAVVFIWVVRLLFNRDFAR